MNDAVNELMGQAIKGSMSQWSSEAMHTKMKNLTHEGDNQLMDKCMHGRMNERMKQRSNAWSTV